MRTCNAESHVSKRLYFLKKTTVLCSSRCYYIMVSTEMILIVPDFTISVSGSSCNYLFFSFIVPPLLSLSIYWHPQSRMGCREMDRDIVRRENETKNERIAWTAVHWNCRILVSIFNNILLTSCEQIKKKKCLENKAPSRSLFRT